MYSQGLCNSFCKKFSTLYLEYIKFLIERDHFSKTSLINFVHDIINFFCFPDENVKKIYEKCNIQKSFLYQNLANTDSTLLFFVFACNMNSQVSEKGSRNIIFEVLTQSKMLERHDLSDNSWKQFN